MTCYSNLCYHFYEMCPVSTLTHWDTSWRSSSHGKSGNSKRGPSNIWTCLQSSSFLFSFLFSFFSLFLCIFYLPLCLWYFKLKNLVDAVIDQYLYGLEGPVEESRHKVAKVRSESEVAQSCRTLSDPIDRSPPGSSIHGIFQARVLEWSAIAFSDKVAKTQYKYLTSTYLFQPNIIIGGIKWDCVCMCVNKTCTTLRLRPICVQLFVTPWAAALQASLSIN